MDRASLDRQGYSVAALRRIDRVLALGGWDGSGQLDRSSLAPAMAPPVVGGSPPEPMVRPVEALPRQRALS